MRKKLKIAHSKFVHHFGYGPECPPTIDFDQDAYAEELEKSVEDDFDYTIEKYGTVPLKSSGWPEEFVD